MKNCWFKTKYFHMFLSLILCIGVSACKKEPEMQAFDVNLSSNTIKPVPTEDLQPITEPQPSESGETKEKLVVVTVGNYGRLNPFVPYKERNLLISEDNSYLEDIPSPPSNLEEDPNLTALVQAKVVGILFDGENSTAIINVLESDHLVHVGDTINEFYIEDITKDQVALRYGLNEYKASVGEIVEGEIKSNTVHNLNNKFAGGVQVINEENFVDVNYINETQPSTEPEETQMQEEQVMPEDITEPITETDIPKEEPKTEEVKMKSISPFSNVYLNKSPDATESLNDNIIINQLRDKIAPSEANN